MVSEELFRSALTNQLEATDFTGLGRRYVGKVRDNYTTDDGRRFIVVTDRISAFDHVLGAIPFKGQVLNRLAAWWFDQTAAIVPNHKVRLADPNVLECIECVPLQVEFIVRAYLTGSTSTSIWTHYQRGSREFCGYKLPEGMREHEKLREPILTPSTKAPKGEHDVSGSREQILATGHVSARDFDEAAELARKLFREGERMCAERGLILVDTKYEFGRTREGSLVVIDEIHTPDSSRFWQQASYGARMDQGVAPEPLDKDFVRRYLVEQGYRGDGPPPPLPDAVRIGAAKRYIEAYERIVGEPFVPNLEAPMGRIARALSLNTETNG